MQACSFSFLNSFLALKLTGCIYFILHAYQWIVKVGMLI